MSRKQIERSYGFHGQAATLYSYRKITTQQTGSTHPSAEKGTGSTHPSAEVYQVYRQEKETPNRFEAQELCKFDRFDAKRQCKPHAKAASNLINSMRKAEEGEGKPPCSPCSPLRKGGFTRFTRFTTIKKPCLCHPERSGIASEASGGPDPPVGLLNARFRASPTLGQSPSTLNTNFLLQKSSVSGNTSAVYYVGRAW